MNTLSLDDTFVRSLETYFRYYNDSEMEISLLRCFILSSYELRGKDIVVKNTISQFFTALMMVPPSRWGNVNYLNSKIANLANDYVIPPAAKIILDELIKDFNLSVFYKVIR